MRDTVRFGIVGCGVIAHFHAQAILAADHAELVGCYGRGVEQTEKYAAHYGIERFDSLRALLASDRIDAVCICTPSGLHAHQAIAALSAGKHVVVEKPMSLTLAEADRLIAAAEASGRKATVISQLRYQEAVRAAKQATDAGALGRIVSASLAMKYFRSADYYASGGWRGTWAMDGGGALMNQGIHGVDILRHLMGPADWVFGRAETLVHSIEVEDTAAAVIGFRNGAVGTGEASPPRHPGYPRRIQICGDKGRPAPQEDSIPRR
ncbi:MAG TPA: Gfo/Idh/MocA family oxidoreductase, partial [Arachnia sp.]|nr:Gfo/Idh/MocA family oxidoreductase [Arachnia sp.]